MIFNLDNATGMHSVLNVSTDELELYGETVTATHGSYSVSGTFNNEGKCTLNVKEVGNYELTCGEATGSVNVPYFGIYSVDVSTIYSTLNITTDEEELLGETVTAVKGSYSVSGVISAEGACTLRVKELGTYNITCGEATDSVNVSEWYHTYNISISLEPIPLVPKLTSNTGSNGIAFGGNSGGNAYKYFDQDITTGWDDDTYFGYQFNTPVVVKELMLYTRPSYNSGNTHKFQASNDGDNWTDLLDTSDMSIMTQASKEYRFKVSNNTAYTRYRVLHANSSGFEGFKECQFYG